MNIMSFSNIIFSKPMENYLFNLSNTPKFLGIITLLNYETLVNSILKEFNMLSFDNDINNKNLLLVDLGFKVGFKNKYRFLVISLSKDNKVNIKNDKLINNYEYLSLDNSLSINDKELIIKEANDIAKKNMDKVKYNIYSLV